MLRTFSAQNFRVFQSFEINGLSRINLIAGRNNTGKTCFLEALFLHLGGHNPEITFRLNMLRGLEGLHGDASETWGWLFHQKCAGHEIRLDSLDTDSNKRSLAISLGKSLTQRHDRKNAQAESPAPPAGAVATESTASTLAYRFDDRGQVTDSHAAIESGGLQIGVGRTPPFPTSVFLATRYRSTAEDSKRFSRLAEELREEEVTQALSIVDPSLTRLTVATFGGAPTISADVGMGRLIPLAFVGEGLVRLLRILLAVLDSRDGAVLVDEIETGFHHSVQKKIWEAIDNACRRANVQLFATTHSRECLLAAHSAFSEMLSIEDGFRVFRLERDEDGIGAVNISAEALDRAESLNWEIR